MPNHPSWPAELVEKARRAINEDVSEYVLQRAIAGQPDAEEAIVECVLSALSGDLVPREEHDKACADGWIVGHMAAEARSQADALAEALERIVGDKTPVADFHFAGRADDREDAMIEIARSALASYKAGSEDGR